MKPAIAPTGPSVIAAFSVVIYVSVALGDDWPMFGRDSTRNMVSPERTAPIRWRVGNEGPPENIKWFARLGTNSCGCPVISGGLVWVGTNIGPLRRGDGEPKLVWSVDMIERLGVVPSGVMIGSEASHCSIGASYGGLIYVNTTNGTRNEDGRVPAAEAPSLVCFRKNTGEVVWQDNSPGHDIIEVQHGSPLVAEIGGRGQVVMAQGDGWLRSFHPLTGELLWKFDMNAKEAEWRRGRGTKNYVLATPVMYEDRVYIANGRHVEFGGGPGRLCCIDPTKSGDVSSQLLESSGNVRPNPNSGLLWEFAAAANKVEGMHSTLSTLAIAEGLVIAPDLDGYVHCLDATTGKEYWTHDLLVSVQGSPLIVDGKVYVGDDEGQIVIFELSKKKKLLATAVMEQIVHSTPVFANGVLYVLTSTHLYAIASDR